MRVQHQWSKQHHVDEVVRGHRSVSIGTSSAMNNQERRNVPIEQKGSTGRPTNRLYCCLAEWCIGLKKKQRDRRGSELI